MDSAAQEQDDMSRGFKTCKDCPDRHVLCHASCQKYIEEKAEHDDLMQKKRLLNDAELCTYKIMACRKERRRKGR